MKLLKLTAVCVSLLLSSPLFAAAGDTTVIAGTGSNSYSGDGGLATSATLPRPASVAIDSNNNIYIATSYDGRIRKIDATSKLISTYAGNGTAYTTEGVATQVGLSTAGDIVFDSSNNLYITDNYVRVFKVDTAGNLTVFAGNGTFGFSGDGGQAKLAGLRSPVALAISPAGSLFIAERNRIRKVNLSTGIITTFAGTGSNPSKGVPANDGSDAITAPIAPTDIAFDTAGNLYLVEKDYYRVRKIDTLGKITTIAGKSTFGFSGDGGLAVNAGLGGSLGIAIDNNNNIFIGSGSSPYSSIPNEIRRIDTNGTIVTVAGKGNSLVNGAFALDAEMGSPQKFAFDSANNLYIADYYNRVRQIVTPGAMVADTTAPVVTAPANVTVAAKTYQGVLISDSTLTSFKNGATAVDNIDGNLTASPTFRGYLPLIDYSTTPKSYGKTTTVTFRATDKWGNIGEATADVTVVDQAPPRFINFPQNKSVLTGTLKTDTSISNKLNSVTAYDDLEKIYVTSSITNNAPSSFPEGITDVTFIAKDSSGNQATRIWQVTGVTDTTPPVITIPASAKFNFVATSSQGVVANQNLPVVTATDNFDGAVTVSNDNTLSFFPIGSTNVTFSATDSANNLASITKTYTVTAPLANTKLISSYQYPATHSGLSAALGKIDTLYSGFGTSSNNQLSIASNGSIYYIASNTVSQIIADGTATAVTFTDTNNLASNASLLNHNAYAIAVSPTGEIAVNFGNNLYLFDSSHNLINDLGNTPASIMQFDGAGNLFYYHTTERYLRRILATDRNNDIQITQFKDPLGFGNSAIVNPTDLAIDGNGNLYGATNKGVYKYDNLFKNNVQLNTTVAKGVAVDKQANVYYSTGISASTGHTIHKIDATTQADTIIAGTAGQQGTTGDKGLATAAKLSGPIHMAIDSNNVLYVTNENSTIRTINALIIDILAPKGTVILETSLANSNRSTNKLNPNFTLTCRDNVACNQMRFSTDNTTWGAWQTYATTYNHTLTGQDGNKTLYVEFKDDAGNVGTAKWDYTLDRTTPTASNLSTTYYSDPNNASNRFINVLQGNTTDTFSTVEVYKGNTKIATGSSGNQNTWTVGLYNISNRPVDLDTLDVYVIDRAGNRSSKLTYTVDLTPPTIILNGGKTANVNFASTYTDLGATVTDNVDTGLTATVINPVNTNYPGIYIVYYSVTDSAGHTTITQRTVTVLPSAAFVAPQFGYLTISGFNLNGKLPSSVYVPTTANGSATQVFASKLDDHTILGHTTQENWEAKFKKDTYASILFGAYSWIKSYLTPMTDITFNNDNSVTFNHVKINGLPIYAANSNVVLNGTLKYTNTSGSTLGGSTSGGSTSGGSTSGGSTSGGSTSGGSTTTTTEEESSSAGALNLPFILSLLVLLGFLRLPKKSA